MKVLVIGSGGREHALVWKLRQSPRVSKLYCAPGNGGIADEAECLPVDLKSLDSMVALAAQDQPDLTVVGPELPLTLGVVDEFTRRGWPRLVQQGRGATGIEQEFRQGIPAASPHSHWRIMPSAIRWSRCARRCRIFILRWW